MYGNVFYFSKINSIGGVESHFWYLSCLYKNFIVMYREGDLEQIKRLSKNVEVIKYNDKMGTIKCKRFFCNYGLDIPVEAEEKYHIIHCDYKHTNFKPIMYEGFKYIAVSKVAKKSFEELTGIEAELIYNPIAIKKIDVPKKEGLNLISATRLSPEKGGERINKLATMLDNAGIKYTWDIYTNRHYRWNSRNIHRQDPKLDLSKEIAEASFLVQLSDHEAFGLSVCESLILGTPVIVTNLPAFREIGCIHGENAVICDLDMKRVDLDLIKKGIPNFNYIKPKSNWGKYLKKTPKYNPNELIKVRTLKRLWDLETNIHYKYNEVTDMKKIRVSELECQGIVERI